MSCCKLGLRIIGFVIALGTTGLPSAQATTWKIDMDEIVCRSKAIVVGVMGEPTEIRREPYRPGQDGRQRERVTYSAQLEVMEVLWGSPYLRILELRSWTINPNDFVLPRTLHSPGSSRPVGRQVIWYLKRSQDFPHWSAIYVTDGLPDRSADRINQTVKRIQQNTLCLQTSSARAHHDGNIVIRFQLELRNPTHENLVFPGFEMRDQRLYSHVPIRLERKYNSSLIEPESGGVIIDSTIPPTTLTPGSRRYFGIDYVVDGQQIGYGWGTSLRVTLEGFGSTNRIGRILR